MRCFFIGNREAGEDLRNQLDAVVERHRIEYGVTQFVVGHYGNFDQMALQSALRLKERFPDITIYILLPYHPSDRKFTLPHGCDGTIYPEGMERVPQHAAIVCANRYMVRHSDYLIAYVKYTAGNASRLLEYARKHADIHITELNA